MSSSTSTLLHDCVIEFMECLVHQLLAVREIYPPHLFERCTKYGISLWQCRHPDVSNYITQVLTNARPALEKNLAEQIIFATYDASNQPVDHINIDCAIVTHPSLHAADSSTSSGVGLENSTTGLTTPMDFVSLEAQLRGAILGMHCQLGRANKTLSKYQQSSRWELLLVLKATPCLDENGERLSDGGSILDSDDVSVVDNLLRCGQWKEDNGQLTRHLVKKCRRSSDSSEGGIRRGEELNDQGPVVIPLVSMQEDRFLDLQINAFKFR